VTHSLTQALALALLLAGCALACGKYGPPVRSHAAPTTASAAATAAPEAEACEEGEEKTP
jgi:hypothetical protein